MAALKAAEADFFRALAEEELFWKQKSRLKWLKEGDRNTRLFHSSVLQCRARQYIGRIQNDQGIWLEDQTLIHAHAIEFYSNLLSKHPEDTSEDAMTRFLEDIPPLITQSQNLALLREVSL